MYTAYFGIVENPFSLTSDPRYLYMSRQHQEALAYLLYGVGASGGLVLLTGEVGAGKTTVCRCLMEQLPEHVDVALLLNPRLSAFELVAALCDELHIRYPKKCDSLKTLVDLLYRYLLDAHSEGRRTVLIIDEAQNLTIEALEQIRMLTNLETDKHKLLQFILIGQPAFLVLLDRPELRQLSPRVTARYHLLPLNEKETIAYIGHRLSVAGLRRNVFSTATRRRIFHYSRGSPLLINTICDRALLGAYARERDTTDIKIIAKAAAEVMGAAANPPAPRVLVRVLLLLFLVGVGYAGARLMTDPVLKAVMQLGVNTGPSSSVPVPVSTEPREMAHIPTAPQEAVGGRTAGPSTGRSEDAVSPSRESRAGRRLALMHRTAGPEELAEPNTAEPPSLLALKSLSQAQFEHALSDLFSLWGVDDQTLAGNSCQRAEAVKLRCRWGETSWEGLRDSNRAAILVMNGDRSGQRFVVLSGLQATRAQVIVADLQFTIPVQILDKDWTGRYLSLWKPPFFPPRVMTPGQRDDSILWLREQLSAIQGETSATADAFLYDAELHRQVLMFQRDKGLQADGIVGPATQQHLQTAVNDRTTPMLWRPLGQRD